MVNSEPRKSTATAPTAPAIRLDERQAIHGAKRNRLIIRSTWNCAGHGWVRPALKASFTAAQPLCVPACQVIQARTSHAAAATIEKTRTPAFICFLPLPVAGVIPQICAADKSGRGEGWPAQVTLGVSDWSQSS